MMASASQFAKTERPQGHLFQRIHFSRRLDVQSAIKRDLPAFIDGRFPPLFFDRLSLFSQTVSVTESPFTISFSYV